MAHLLALVGNEKVKRSNTYVSKLVSKLWLVAIFIYDHKWRFYDHLMIFRKSGPWVFSGHIWVFLSCIVLTAGSINDARKCGYFCSKRSKTNDCTAVSSHFPNRNVFISGCLNRSCAKSGCLGSSASEMTYIVSSGALNSTHWDPAPDCSEVTLKALSSKLLLVRITIISCIPWEKLIKKCKTDNK